MLTLNEKDLKDLNTFIQELPLKHGLPLLNFINAKLQEQTKEEAPKEEKTKK
jgi:hypothetical protein